MQRKIGDDVQVGATVFTFYNIGGSSAIDRAASNYTDAKEKVLKLDN